MVVAPRIVSTSLLLLVVLLQLSIVQRLEVAGGAPDLVVLTIVSIGLLTNSVSGAAHGFVGGLALGAFAAVPLGPHALLGTLIGYTAGRTGEVLVTDDHPAPPLVAGILGVLTMQLGRPLVEFLVNPALTSLDGTWGAALVVTILSAVLAVPVYLLVRRVLWFGEQLAPPAVHDATSTVSRDGGVA